MNKYCLILLALIVLICLFLTTELSWAQAPPPPPSKPAQNPIDGCLGILAVAGGAYAIKKIRDKKK